MLSKPAALVLQASLVVSFLAGSAAPTPLYAVYQAAWGFTPITVTVVFGVYALAVLATLLVAGSLSDYVGRRPVLFVATLLQIGAMLVFATADGLAMLVAGRVVQGIATGGAAAAIGAAMIDLDRTRGTLANAVGPMTGTATGSLVSGLLVQYAPAPAVLVYAVLAGVLAVQAIGIAWMPETVARRPGALATLRPRFAVPPQVRNALLVATPALVAAWALAGFWGSLGPALVRQLVGSQSRVLGGLPLFVLAASGASTVFALRQRGPHAVMRYGSAALATGVAVTLLALSAGSLPLLFAGCVVAGSGFGAAFHGAIRMVLPLAAPAERAGVLSVVYVVAYLAMGVPAVLAGIRVVHGDGLLATAHEYGLAIIGLATLALAGALALRMAPSRST